MLLSLENKLQQELMLSEQNKRLLSFDLTDFWNFGTFFWHTFNEVFNRKNITKNPKQVTECIALFLEKQ